MIPRPPEILRIFTLPYTLAIVGRISRGLLSPLELTHSILHDVGYAKAKKHKTSRAQMVVLNPRLLLPTKVRLDSCGVRREGKACRVPEQ